MSSYGRNFGFRVQPKGGQRAGRYYNSEATAIPIGAPVLIDVDGDKDSAGRIPVELATGAQAKPENGLGGIALYEYAFAAFAGDDENLTTAADKDTVPAGAPCMVIFGDDVKVVLKNTEDRTFLHNRSYDGRVMVAGLGGATPTVEVGEYLTPGTGSDQAGYWAVNATAANAWLVVTNVENNRDELEARLNF